MVPARFSLVFIGEKLIIVEKEPMMQGRKEEDNGQIALWGGIL